MTAPKTAMPCGRERRARPSNSTRTKSRRLASKFEGYFWTVYPKQTVSFKVLEGLKHRCRHLVRHNYHAIGKTLNNKVNTIWVRPVVTVSEADSRGAGGGRDPQRRDRGRGAADLSGRRRGAGALDRSQPLHPRRAATPMRATGRASKNPGRASSTRPTSSTGVSEMPFMHFNKPLASIGELGHLYAAYERRTEGEHASSSAQRRNYGTLTFSTRSGAALLDLFTVSPANAPPPRRTS